MDFFNQFDKIDDAVNRAYTRWKKWIWVSLITLVVGYGGWVLWAAIWGPPTGGVSLIIHTRIDRPILGFSVNGVGGGNSPAYVDNPYAGSGGAVTCCGIIKGKTAEVIWTLDMTHEQYLKGLRLETRRVVVPLPKRKWGENDLHVYFLPGDKVLLGWSDDAWSPFERPPEISAKKMGGK